MTLFEKAARISWRRKVKMNGKKAVYRRGEVYIHENLDVCPTRPEIDEITRDHLEMESKRWDFFIFTGDLKGNLPEEADLIIVDGIVYQVFNVPVLGPWKYHDLSKVTLRVRTQELGKQ